MKHFIIGTAGHVDHGKTMLVKALTGKDTDRLKEERERGISIELGFAPFKLPSGIMAGVVDVPGHERFIKNMLAGVGGMDLVLLVVAADEGIMPQTREHLDIIDLLQVPGGIIVLTKADLVEEDWLELVTEETRELVLGTVLENAPVAAVSAVTGQGIGELIELIDGIAHDLQERPVKGKFRMPVDRVFSMTGFGTVVTGTLAEGILKPGDTVEIAPEGIEARVRGLQVHGVKVDLAEAGQRVAINLAGVEREQIERGSVVCAPGSLTPSHRLDVRLKLLPGAGKPLANRTRVRVHIGTDEVLARIILLEAEEMEPGTSGFAQLECEQPLTSARGDRLVIRSYSPMRTIAGGKVIDPHPPKRKRLDPAVIEMLVTKEKGTPEELLQQFMSSAQKTVYTVEEVTSGLGFDRETSANTLEVLVSCGEARRFSADNRVYYVLSGEFFRRGDELVTALEKFHKSYPLRSGMSKEEVRSRHFSFLNNKVFNALMEQYGNEGMINIAGENVVRYGFQPKPGPDQEAMFGKIEEKYLVTGYQTPGWDEITREFKLGQEESEELLNYYTSNQILVKLEDSVLIHRVNLEKARDLIVNFLKTKGEMTLAEVRDLLNTSRKFALPIISYFDKVRVTRRLEDKRVLY